MTKENEKMVSVENLLYEDLVKEETRDPEKFYKAKIPSIKHAQKLGIEDDVIEMMLGLKIKPEDRKG